MYAQAPPRDNVAPPAVGTARISGRIIAADTGNPIARASVQFACAVVFRPYSTGRPETWNLKAVKFGGADITDAGYDVRSDLDWADIKREAYHPDVTSRRRSSRSCAMVTSTRNFNSASARSRFPSP